MGSMREGTEHAAALQVIVLVRGLPSFLLKCMHEVVTLRHRDVALLPGFISFCLDNGLVSLLGR